jgi:hypothetical protein
VLPIRDPSFRLWWLGRRELAVAAVGAAGLGLALGTGLARALPRSDVAAAVAILFACLAAAAKRASP